MQKQKSFTLIELLVVIAIIGLLSSIVSVGIKEVRERARDAIRKQDLHTIQIALETYWQFYEHYPPEALYCDSSIGGSGTVCPINPPQDYWHPNSDLQDLVSEGFLGTIPVDPINDASYYYWYEPDNVDQGSPPCQANSCRWSLCCRLETTGGSYCIYSIEQGP